MPVYVYECLNKRRAHTFESYFSVGEIKEGKDDPEKLFCPQCMKPVKKIVSSFFGKVGSLKWAGIDDTDELTLGKVAADGKIPAEFKRDVIKNKKFYKELAAKEKAHRVRQKKHKFKDTE